MRTFQQLEPRDGGGRSPSRERPAVRQGGLGDGVSVAERQNPGGGKVAGAPRRVYRTLGLGRGAASPREPPSSGCLATRPHTPRPGFPRDARAGPGASPEGGLWEVRGWGSSGVRPRSREVLQAGPGGPARRRHGGAAPPPSSLIQKLATDLGSSQVPASSLGEGREKPPAPSFLPGPPVKCPCLSSYPLCASDPAFWAAPTWEGCPLPTCLPGTPDFPGQPVKAQGIPGGGSV